MESTVFKKSVATVIKNVKSHVQHSPLVMKRWEQSRDSFTLKSTGLFLVLGRLLFLSVSAWFFPTLNDLQITVCANIKHVDLLYFTVESDVLFFAIYFQPKIISTMEMQNQNT